MTHTRPTLAHTPTQWVAEAESGTALPNRLPGALLGQCYRDKPGLDKASGKHASLITQLPELLGRTARSVGLGRHLSFEHDEPRLWSLLLGINVEALVVVGNAPSGQTELA